MSRYRVLDCADDLVLYRRAVAAHLELQEVYEELLVRFKRVPMFKESANQLLRSNKDAMSQMLMNVRGARDAIGGIERIMNGNG